MEKSSSAAGGDAERLAHARSAVDAIFGPVAERAFAVRYWDRSLDWMGSGTPSFTVVIRRSGSLRRMLLPPSELSIVEAIISGDVEIEGDAERAMTLGDAIARRLRSPRALATLARHLLALPRHDTEAPLPAVRAAEVVAPVGARHAPERDRAAIRYHYDVGNDFYSLWLDRRMVYSCAYFERADRVDADLDDAQRDKLDLICRKLRLSAGDRLLDVGCGWGGLIMHAAEHYGVSAVGITLSDAQAAFARERIAAAGLTGRCTVEIRDYRSIEALGRFDRIASVGMVEHVGVANLPTYFSALHRALRPGGLLLNHGIVNTQPQARERLRDRLEQVFWRRDAFIDQYVFPDGKLGPLSAVVAAAEGAGFEARDLESLREHYALTLRAWVTRLTRNAEQARAVTDDRTYRTWWLYMTASAQGFASGRLNVVQLLLARADAGAADIPLRRGYMLG